MIRVYSRYNNGYVVAEIIVYFPNCITNVMFWCNKNNVITQNPLRVFVYITKTGQ